MFDQYGNYTGAEIPEQCVHECTIPGQDVTNAVNHWREKLDFNCPREMAINYLIDFGAWTSEELIAKSTDELSAIVLWIACNDIKDQGEWFGMIH